MSQPAVAHVVWDWNGTLLDDFALTARIATDTLASLGVPGVSADDVRASFARPLSRFYERLLGRPPTADELDYIVQRFHDEYEAAVHRVPLRRDAHAALEQVRTRASQSLLSMARHGQLQELVERHGIRHRFTRVEGSPTQSTDGSKAARLQAHLLAIGVDPRRTVVIGDTVDDYEASVTADARAVLVTTGTTARGPLEATGAPVADTLLEAAELALG